MNNKRILSFFVLLTFSTIAMAQASGGQIRRKPQTTTSVKPSRSNTNRNKPASPKMSKTEKDRIIQNIINNMVYVVGGSFMMGATSEQKEITRYLDCSIPVHQVTLSSYSIGRYEVTQEEWEAVMGERLYSYKDGRRPVTPVSWDMCQEFIRKLNAYTGMSFRLPTEAEWEYAARGGVYSRGYRFSGSNSIDEVAWHRGNADFMNKGEYVGMKKPNELGIYDMTGNVEEWCQDWYGKYDNSNQVNPRGPSSGNTKVVRGESVWASGGTYDSNWNYFTAARSGFKPDWNIGVQGFRLAK
jgi:formylglycine-generating enzyme required for sulfatase activity